MNRAFYLKADSYAVMVASLLQAGVLVDLGGGGNLVMPAVGVQLAMLGTLYGKPRTGEPPRDEHGHATGEPEQLPPAALAGYHANLIVYDAFEGDLAPVAPLILPEPVTPIMPAAGA